MERTIGVGPTRFNYKVWAFILDKGYKPTTAQRQAMDSDSTLQVRVGVYLYGMG